MRVFANTLRKFIHDNIRTKSGEYLPLNQMYQTDVLSLDIPLSQLNISEKYWIDPKIIGILEKNLDITINKFPLINVVKEANNEKLGQWIASLQDNEYNIFIDKLNESKEDIHNTRFLRSNKKNHFSVEEVKECRCAFFVTEHVHVDVYKSDLEIEYIPYQYKKLTDMDLYKKIISQIEYLSSSDTLKCIVINLLNTLIEEYPELKSQILEEVAIFKNQLNQRRAFKSLFNARPFGTTLFDPFVVSGFIPENMDRRWFLSTPQEQWDWVIQNLDSITSGDIEWGGSAMRNLEDIKRLANQYPIESFDKEKYLSINLNSNGNPTEKDVVFLHNADKLTEAEYNFVANFFYDRTFIPFQFSKILSSKPFKAKTKELEESDIIESFSILPEKIFEYLLKAISFENWLSKYRIIKHINGYEFKPLEGGENYYSNSGNEVISKLLESEKIYNIPQELQRLLQENNLTSDYCIESNPQLAIRILSLVENVNPLLPIVKESNSEVKNKYFKRISKIELSVIESAESLEWRILQFAVKETAIDNIKYKLLFDGQEIPTSIKEDNIIIGKNDYSLSCLMNEIEDENNLILQVLDQLPNGKYFKEHYLEEERIDAYDVFDELDKNNLDIYQLRFCLDYAITNDISKCSFKKRETISYLEVLNMVYSNKLKDFDKYVELPDFDPKIQFYANDRLLLSEEKLPDYINEWIAKNDVQLCLELLTVSFDVEDSKYIKIRKSFLDETPFTKDESIENCVKLQNTLKWIIKQDKNIIYNSLNFKTINTFISSLPKDITTRFFLRFMEFSIDSNKPSIAFKFEEYIEDGFFLDDSYLSNSIMKDFTPKEVEKIFQQTKIYYKKGDKTLLRFSIHDSQEIKIISELDKNPIDITEWKDETYNEWKKKEKENITISLSLRRFGVKISMCTDNYSLYSQNMTREHSFYMNNIIIYQSEKSTYQDVLKTLEEHLPDMEDFKEPFIRLQSLFLNKLNIIGDILKDFSEDEINKIKERSRYIKQVLDNPPPEDVEPIDDEEPQIEPTYGYIGELIYKEFLKKSGFNCDYSAEKGIGAYDFKYEKDENTIYVDVKTTITSVKDGEAPFYIHKEQNKFMRKNPTVDYRIVRLSLKDMKIHNMAKKIKIQHPKKNPRKDKNLKNECEKISKQYWESHKIKDFEDTIYEYKVAIQ